MLAKPVLANRLAALVTLLCVAAAKPGAAADNDLAQYLDQHLRLPEKSTCEVLAATKALLERDQKVVPIGRANDLVSVLEDRPVSAFNRLTCANYGIEMVPFTNGSNLVFSFDAAGGLVSFAVKNRRTLPNGEMLGFGAILLPAVTGK